MLVEYEREVKTLYKFPNLGLHDCRETTIFDHDHVYQSWL